MSASGSARTAVLLPHVRCSCSRVEPVFAQKTDIVRLANGDRFTGEVKSVRKGQLEFSTDDAGTHVPGVDQGRVPQSVRPVRRDHIRWPALLGSRPRAPARTLIVRETTGEVSLSRDGRHGDRPHRAPASGTGSTARSISASATRDRAPSPSSHSTRTPRSACLHSRRGSTGRPRSRKKTMTASGTIAARSRRRNCASRAASVRRRRPRVRKKRKPRPDSTVADCRRTAGFGSSTPIGRS